MKTIFIKYFSIPRNIIYLMVADVFLQLINAAFTLLLNYLMLDHGFKDFEIASMVGNRYLTVLLCSIPLALFVKGKELKPFMLAGSVLTPLIALLLIFGIHTHNSELIRLLMSLWGISFSLLQILVLPYILLNGSKEHETESIVLFFAAGNFTTILAGLMSFLLPLATPYFSTEKMLILYSVIAFAGVYFVLKLPKNENLGTKIPIKNIHHDYDWNLITEAAIPTFLIAFGAGFTIPVINLFFHDVHGMNAENFSLMNSLAFTLVAISGLLVPEIKRRFGYKIAITLVQIIAIVLLFAMATTEWYSHTVLGLLVAVITFVLRQPLMNMAAPMTGELTLKYVGERNREMISAINASIWSGCWFASAKIFSILREAGVSYSNIIFITVGFYIFGVAWYQRLINKVENVPLEKE
ncbi:MAG: MFS transporter [Chitinophagales bacterium]|nr:MFS transporter [Chitinophagales bacterium]MCO5281205.1 MFS transporter [Chitinophagales bacterium]